MEEDWRSDRGDIVGDGMDVRSAILDFRQKFGETKENEDTLRPERVETVESLNRRQPPYE